MEVVMDQYDDYTTTQAPPHNADAEKSVIGCLLLEPPRIAEIGRTLDSTSFYDSHNATIYRVMLDLYARAGAVDQTLVLAELKTSGNLNGFDYQSHLLECAQKVGAVSHATYYADIVARLARQRRAMLAAMDALSKARAGKVDEALADMRASAEEIGSAENERPRFISELITSAELVDRDTHVDFLVDGVLVKGQNHVGGGLSKTLKTNIIGIDLGLSVAAGVPFLGRFEAEQGNVLFCSSESGDATIQRNAKVIAEQKGIDLRSCPMYWTFACPKLSQQDHLYELHEAIVQKDLTLVTIDPLYLALLDTKTAANSKNIFFMGPALLPLSEIAQATGCTISVLHHFRKNSQGNLNEPAGLEELSQAGLAEWARQWCLLQRRSPYKHDGIHELWMRVGGSAGHGSLWGVTIDEGVFPNRRWDVLCEPIHDTKAEMQREREQRKAEELQRKEDEHCRRLHAVLRQFSEGETAKVLRTAAGLNADNFARAVHTLLVQGKVVSCMVSKTRGQYDGFILTEEGKK